MSWTTFPIAKAVSGLGHGLVAKKGAYEVYADRSRRGMAGNKKYLVTFSVVKVESTSPRKISEVVLPDTCRSSLDKALAYLDSLES